MSLLCYGLGASEGSCTQLRMCVKQVAATKCKIKKTTVKCKVKQIKLRMKVCEDG